MAKAAILVPYAEMCELARPMLGNYSHIIFMCVEYTKTEQIAQRALELSHQGCELIIARGFQAELVKRCVKLPVVEIRAAAQELGALVLNIKEELQAARPKIGIISFANMLCDTSRFDELFQVDLQRYLVKSGEELDASVDRAIQDGCQAVIGGDVVCAKAQELGLPCRFIPSGQESLRDALNIAERICYAIDLEKSNSAEMNTMLDFTFSGIMQVNLDGTIYRANRIAFNLLNRRPGDMIGKNVLEILPQLTEASLNRALRDGEEAYAILIPIRQREVVVNIAPITIDETIKGAILTFQEGARIVEMETELRRELYQHGYIAQYTFARLPFSCAESLDFVNTAKRIAKYNTPVFIAAEPGCGKGLVAQCIHNESFAQGNAFIRVDCSAYQPDTLDTMLFGNYSTRRDTPACIVETAQNGTLYLSHVETLSSELQYKLLDLIRGKFLHNGNSRPSMANVRVIASSSANLITQVERGEFRGDLYYALSVVKLDIPPLRHRRGDILGWVDFYLKDWQSQYKRYVNLTQGAKDFLENYDWPGNLDQVNNICQRIVLLTEKRNIDEVFLRRQLEQIAPKVLHGTDQVVIFKDEKAARIAELLRQYNGNRQQVADELGISKTTLWRYMKKFGIGQDYSY